MATDVSKYGSKEAHGTRKYIRRGGSVEYHKDGKLVRERTKEGPGGVDVARIGIVATKSGKGISKSKRLSSQKELQVSKAIQKEQERINKDLLGLGKKTSVRVTYDPASKIGMTFKEEAITKSKIDRSKVAEKIDSQKMKVQRSSFKGPTPQAGLRDITKPKPQPQSRIEDIIKQPKPSVGEQYGPPSDAKEQYYKTLEITPTIAPEVDLKKVLTISEEDAEAYFNKQTIDSGILEFRASVLEQESKTIDEELKQQEKLDAEISKEYVKTLESGEGQSAEFQKKYDDYVTKSNTLNTKIINLNEKAEILNKDAEAFNKLYDVTVDVETKTGKRLKNVKEFFTKSPTGTVLKEFGAATIFAETPWEAKKRHATGEITTPELLASYLGTGVGIATLGRGASIKGTLLTGKALAKGAYTGTKKLLTGKGFGIAGKAKTKQYSKGYLANRLTGFEIATKGMSGIQQAGYIGKGAAGYLGQGLVTTGKTAGSVLQIMNIGQQSGELTFSEDEKNTISVLAQSGDIERANLGGLQAEDAITKERGWVARTAKDWVPGTKALGYKAEKAAYKKGVEKTLLERGYSEKRAKEAANALSKTRRSRAYAEIPAFIGANIRSEILGRKQGLLFSQTLPEKTFATVGGLGFRPAATGVGRAVQRIGVGAAATAPAGAAEGGGIYLISQQSRDVEFNPVDYLKSAGIGAFTAGAVSGGLSAVSPYMTSKFFQAGAYLSDPAEIIGDIGADIVTTSRKGITPKGPKGPKVKAKPDAPSKTFTQVSLVDGKITTPKKIVPPKAFRTKTIVDTKLTTQKLSVKGPQTKSKAFAKSKTALLTKTGITPSTEIVVDIKPGVETKIFDITKTKSQSKTQAQVQPQIQPQVKVDTLTDTRTQPTIKTFDRPPLPFYWPGSKGQRRYGKGGIPQEMFGRSKLYDPTKEVFGGLRKLSTTKAPINNNGYKLPMMGYNTQNAMSQYLGSTKKKSIISQNRRKTKKQPFNNYL